MRTEIIKVATDLEMLIGDRKAGMVSDKEFTEKIRELAFRIIIDADAEQIEKDLEAGKVVFGRRKNPETGELEPIL